MNASTRKCTDSKPCNLMNCYACRRRLIDETAIAMLDSGADQETVERYRCSAINALAFEIQAPAPAKPKARKASAPLTAEQTNAHKVIADKLRVCGSREYAAQLLEGLRIVDLQSVWTLAGRTDKMLGKLKADKVSHMIENLVGYRLASNAIMNGAKA